MNTVVDREDDKSEELSSSGKTLDRALVLPVIGLVFLVPPVASIFQLDLFVAGIPFTALYLFTVWGLLIAGAAMLSGKLRSYPQDRQKSIQANNPAK